MKKTLGQICYEEMYKNVHYQPTPWAMITPQGKSIYNSVAKAIERAVLRRLKEGKKKPTRFKLRNHKDCL